MTSLEFHRTVRVNFMGAQHNLASKRIQATGYSRPSDITLDVLRYVLALAQLGYCQASAHANVIHGRPARSKRKLGS